MRKAYLELHLAVFLFGFTAILGKLITIPAVSLVWWRVMITSVSLLFLVGIVRTLRQVPMKRILQYVGIGCIVALHWITFFGSIKTSNASIALAALATTSFFTSLIEPLIMRQRALGLEILVALLIVPAMILVAHGIDPEMHMGIWLGLASAILAAFFASLNKLLISHAKPLQITFFELGSAFLFVSLILLIIQFMLPDNGMLQGIDFRLHLPKGLDWVYLLILALICTTFAYVLAIKVLHHISAFAANLVINLEPVYGITLAWILLKENRELTPGFYIGVFIIIGVVFLYPFIKWRKGSRDQRIKGQNARG
ncbi:MAG TPA: DMT family transporter [Saprospiraceae bacterium]|nr:DMT family transporter [Saprospiraceae bacterium]